MKPFKTISASWKQPMGYLVFALMVVQQACTSQMYISTTKPAEVTVAYDQWKVVVLNRFNPGLLPFEREKKIDAFSAGAREAFYGAVAAILDDSTYSLMHTDTLNYLAQTKNDALDPALIQQIHQQHPHHLLLSLDHFDTFLEQEISREEDSDGAVSKTAHYTLVAKSFWTLFDSTGAVLDKITIREAEPYQSRMVLSGLLAIGPSLSNAGPAINKLAWYSGNSYWRRLSPQEVNYPRLYYVSKKMQAATQAMIAADWDVAISLLQPLAESNQKGAARAAYNLAVVYEAQGNVQQARYWASKAMQKHDGLALQLLNHLERHWGTRR